MSVLWREPENNGTIINYTVQVQMYQLVSESSKKLELVAVDPEFKQTISATSLTLSRDGRFMINISEGLGETE